MTHSSKSGVADLAFENDIEAIMLTRRFVNFIPSSNRERAPVWPTEDSASRAEISLDSLVPDDPAKPYNIKELIVKIADEGKHARPRPPLVERQQRCLGILVESNDRGAVADVVNVLRRPADTDCNE